MGDGGRPSCANVPMVLLPLVFATLPTGGDLLSPLCRSSSAACVSSRTTLAGQRPAAGVNFDGSKRGPVYDDGSPDMPCVTLRPW